MNIRWVCVLGLVFVITLTGSLLLCADVLAQSSDVESQLQDLQEVIEMMRASGKSEEQIEQFETTMKGMIEQEAAVTTAKKASQSKVVSSAASNPASSNGKSRGTLARQTFLPSEVSSGTLLLAVGREIFEFDTGYCNATEYRTGNLMVEFDVTATGTFRGRPAIALLSKSHAAEIKQEFNDIDLYLGELTKEQRLLAPWLVKQKLFEVWSSWETERNAELQAKYSTLMHDDLPMDEMMKLGDEQSIEYKRVRQEAQAMQFPHAFQNQKEIEIAGQVAHFIGPAMSTQDVDRAPEFQNLGSVTEIRVRCD